MALSNLSGWNEKADAGAQGPVDLGSAQTEAERRHSSACGSACGSGDKNASDGSMEEKPAACGSACGSGDKNASDGSMEEKPAACGSACGAGDK